VGIGMSSDLPSIFRRLYDQISAGGTARTTNPVQTTAIFGVWKGILSGRLTPETPCSKRTFLSDAPLAQLDRALDY